MKTRVYRKNQLDQIAAVLKSSGLVAFPTDTVFGLACDSSDLSAIEKMKLAKGRPEEKPFPMMVSSLEQLATVAIFGERERKVIAKFMPGALTIVFNKQPSLAPVVTNGFPTVGVRMPNDPWVLSLIEAVGHPLLVPSANLSGASVCTNHLEVILQLQGRIEGVVAGESGAALSSTIIDMSGPEVKLLRVGKITLEEILEVIR